MATYVREKLERSSNFPKSLSGEHEVTRSEGRVVYRGNAHDFRIAYEGIWGLGICGYAGLDKIVDGELAWSASTIGSAWFIANGLACIRREDKFGGYRAQLLKSVPPFEFLLDRTLQAVFGSIDEELQACYSRARYFLDFYIRTR